MPSFAWTGAFPLYNNNLAPLTLLMGECSCMQGIERLMLLTTRTADWFQQRAFTLEGTAHSSKLLPPDRRARVNAARNSRLYSKKLHQLDEYERQAPAGRRIGF